MCTVRALLFLVPNNNSHCIFFLLRRYSAIFIEEHQPKEPVDSLKNYSSWPNEYPQYGKTIYVINGNVTIIYPTVCFTEDKKCLELSFRVS